MKIAAFCATLPIILYIRKKILNRETGPAEWQSISSSKRLAETGSSMDKGKEGKQTTISLPIGIDKH
jgi:hypothetical protein